MRPERRRQGRRIRKARRNGTLGDFYWAPVPEGGPGALPVDLHAAWPVGWRRIRHVTYAGHEPFLVGGVDLNTHADLPLTSSREMSMTFDLSGDALAVIDEFLG